MLDIKRFGFFAAAALAVFLGMAGSAAGQPAGVSGILSSPYTSWFPIVIVAALVVLSIVAFVYMLAPLMGRNELRSWARLQFYGVLFSIVLIVVFEVFGALIYTVNPEPAMQGVGLVPGGLSSCTGTTNLFSLSLCDIYQFQGTVATVNDYVFGLGIMSSITPRMSVSTTPVEGVSDLGLGFTFSLMPISTATMLGSLISALALAYTINQVQLIIIAASMLIFAVFMAIGLIARIFGITRSFGGAMIAFALGIGFVYPLMVSVTYGFIDYVISNVGPRAVLTVLSLIPSLIPLLFTAALGGTTTAGLITGYLSAPLLEYFGLVGVGLLFVPFLNFLIVDTFIIDFSQAVGERMDFMSLLAGLV